MSEHLKTKNLKALVYRIPSKPVYRDTHDKVCILSYRVLKQIITVQIMKLKLSTEKWKKQSCLEEGETEFTPGKVLKNMI